jgi:opacity protein-like surface antigen
MKKTLSVLTLSLIPTFCSAHSGIYAGAGVGANIITGSQNTIIAALDEGRYPFNYGLRGNAASGEVFAGYGHFFGPYYLGMEALYSSLNTSSEFKSTFSGHQQEIITTKLKDGYGAAFRLGYQIQNSILAYLRLGWESRRISVTFTDLDGFFVPLNKGYRSNAFVPGLGTEVKITDNLFLRLEVRSAFHQKKNVNVEQSATNYTRITTTPKLHTLLVGLTYRC